MSTSCNGLITSDKSIALITRIAQFSIFRTAFQESQ
jgi:hypothetical protein